jgi:UDP-GlcNAc:undecaprenyl-phosphate GlcNAc-1-phosphate transferase
MNPLVFITSFFIGLVLTYLLRIVALKLNIVDVPRGRHAHKETTPYLGGVALFITFSSVVMCFLPIDKHILGLLLGGLFIVIVGVLDDILSLSPAVKLGAQLLSALILIIFGVGIENITSPLGGLIELSTFNFPISIFGISRNITLLADLFTIGWVMFLINAMNFLDGSDGLSGSVGFVSAMILFSLALLPEIGQHDLGLICLALAGSLLAFLSFNFPPAKIFFGDAGSMFLGFVLAAISILSSGKIATLTLLLGVPILDLIWVAGRRVFVSKTAPWRGDRTHIHHRLLELGAPPSLVVILISGVSLLFGLAALHLHSFEKLIAIILLGVLVIGGLTIAETLKKR